MAPGTGPVKIRAPVFTKERGLVDHVAIGMRTPGGIQDAASRKREIAFLFVLLVTLLLLFNQLTISRNRWTLHPDDQDLFLFSSVLLHTGNLWCQSPLNDEYDTDAFRPGIDEYRCDDSSGHKIRANYTPGIYFLLCPGHLVGFRGPFVIVSIMGVLGVLFLYLLVRELYDYRIAMMAAALLGFSAPYIFWSNMLFSNIPAVSLFLGGLYFLARAVRHDGKRIDYLATIAFFSFAVWIRYEFILLVLVVLLVVTVTYRKRLRRRYVMEAAVLVVLIGALLTGLNYLTTGSIFGLHPETGMGSTASTMLVQYPTSMLRYRVVQTIATNARMYIYGVSPILTVIGLLGIVYCLRKKRDGFLVAILLVGLLVLYYFGKGTGFWGYGDNIMAASYTRYFLPVLACLAVFAGVFCVRYLGEHLNRRAVVLVLALVITAHVVVSMNMAAGMKFGLNYVDKYFGHRRDTNYFVAGLQEAPVLVDLTRGGFYEKMILSRTVLVPQYIPENEREERTVEIITDLVSRGVPVYVLDTTERSLFNRDSLDAGLDPFYLQEIEHPVIYEVGGKTPEIFEVLRVD